MGWTGYCVAGEHTNCTDTHKDRGVCDCPCHLKTHPKVRNAFALHATMRKAVRFKHKTEPRKGARNLQRDYKEEV